MHPSAVLKYFITGFSVTVANTLPIKHNATTSGEVSNYPLYARFEEVRTFSVHLKQYVNKTKCLTVLLGTEICMPEKQDSLG